jgi:formate dehydrogenase major subunit
VPGLGTSFGRGGATTFAADMKHADAILIMGSNMAECHPVAFRWVMQARTRSEHPCTVIHADPRFTRTSAMANIYAPLRAGSDIVFLGALIHRVLQYLDEILRKPEGQRTPRERFFVAYLVRYTNAATIITGDFRDTEDAAGLFSGFNPETRTYDPRSWRYETQPGDRRPQPGGAESFSERVGRLVGPAARQDPSLRDARCVFRILERHYRRYTAELVEQVCGTPPDVFDRVAKALWENAGPERSGAICYAVGWTQHTTGVQMIRAAGILQLLLGNIGRPGGGILALRGHATIQGSTDIATLYNIHPGYLNTPSALRPHDTLGDYLSAETNATSYWSNMPKFMVSQLKAWYGAAATAANDYAYDYLPKIIGDHSHLPMFVAMHEGHIDGFFAMGQNPAVGGQNAGYQREALARLKWLVVRDLYETETASFWKDSPEVHGGRLRPQAIDTEVFFLPAAAVPEMDGSFTNTQRLVQWHEKAVDPPGEARSDLWFTFHLGRKLKELYRQERGRGPQVFPEPIEDLVWDYLDEDANQAWRIKDEPSAERVLREINGYDVATGAPLASFADLKDDGSTACGAWIYTGIYAGGRNHAANRQGDDWVSLGWGFSWPANRRLMYNRCSADPDGQPWAKEARLARQYSSGRLAATLVGIAGQPAGTGPLTAAASLAAGPLRGYVYWDGRRWTGFDVPDFVVDKAPTTAARPGAVGLAGHDGASPFIMKGDGKGWLFAPSGLVDGPLPAHYEPYESPLANAVYPALRQRGNPAVLVYAVRGNAYAPVGSPDYPHVLSTYRLTEHHLSGTMSRWLPWLAELQPELFCEISPEHAQEIGVANTDVVVISTPRGSIQAKALVTRRIRPFRVGGRTVHHVGLPWHWGYKGVTKGDVANNLSALVADPNVTIHEAKVFVCQVAKAR